MSSFTIVLPDEEAARLQLTSAAKGTTPEKLAADFVASALGASKQPSRQVDLSQWCGVASSGIPDLATNPAHLEGLGAD